LAGIKIIQVPFSSKIRIETRKPNGQEIQLTMSDIKGSLLHKASIFDSSYDFDPGSLPNGVYVLNILIGGKKIAHKLIL